MSASARKGDTQVGIGPEQLAIMGTRVDAARGGSTGRSTSGRGGGRGRRPLTLIALVGLLWALSPVPAASAHAYLLASTPSSGYAITSPPTAITLDFDEAVTVGSRPMVLTDTAGGRHELGSPAVSLGGRRVSAPVPTPLADGGYRVDWQVTGDDGDPMSGVITFSVGAGTAVPAAAGDAPPALDAPVVVAMRWVLFLGLALGLGGLTGDRLARRVLREVRSVVPPPPRPAVLLGAGLGAVAVAVLAALQVGSDPVRLITTGPGQILLIELAGFLLAMGLALVAHTRPAPVIRVGAAAALLAVVAAEGLRAHPGASSPIWGTVLTMVHLVSASVWIGGLVHVVRAGRLWRGQERAVGSTRLLVVDYSRLALILVLVVVVTGVLQTVILLPDLAALVDTTYGVLLLAKVALVVLVLGLAVLARRRLQRSIRTLTGAPLGRGVRAEAAGLVGVLAVTAVLVSVVPAGPATATLAAPPAPVGPVVPAGTLAGQVTVIATASEGRLVIRMSTPERDDLGTDEAASGEAGGSTPAQIATAAGAPAAADYRVTALLTAPEEEAKEVTLRGCGAGCFTAPVQWQEGTSDLRLDIVAPPWRAGIANLEIPWPPRTDPAMLGNVLTAMRNAPSMTVYQAVTSDYDGDAGPEARLSLSGAEFLDSEPYGGGGGDPVVFAGDSGELEVRLSFPQGIAIRMLLSSDYRILRQEATTPNHLIISTFEYPPDQE